MTVYQKKICLLGDFAVGKTSLVRQYVEGRFDDKYLSTIGVKISRRSIERPYGTLNLLVWDLSGGDDFNPQTSYLRGAAGAIIVCDLTRSETLAAFERYTHQLHQVSPQALVVFAANKADLSIERVISPEDLQSIRLHYGGEVFETSAKTGLNVAATFLSLAEAMENQGSF